MSDDGSPVRRRHHRARRKKATPAEPGEPQTGGLSQARRGGSRERKVVRCLRLVTSNVKKREDPMMGGGWIATRTPASRAEGGMDIVALKAGERPMLVQVKATMGGPFDDFGPADRAALLAAAVQADADAWLVWWPYDSSREGARWIPPSEWPEARRARAAAK